MNHEIENSSPPDNFDYDGKCYPDLSKRELKLLVCIDGTMKDFNWTVADALEVEARMTLNLSWLESNDYKPSHEQIRNKLLPDEYKNILSNLISKNIYKKKR